MDSKHDVDRRFSDYRPNTPTPLADSNEEEGFRWRGLERHKLMVVRMVMIVTVVIVTAAIMNVVLVMISVWSSNNGDSTDNCVSKGTLFYWHSQVYRDYASRSQFRVLFRRNKI